MRARAFKVGLFLLLALPVALSLGLAAALVALGWWPVLIGLILAPLICMVGAGLLPDT